MRADARLPPGRRRTRRAARGLLAAVIVLAGCGERGDADAAADAARAAPPPSAALRATLAAHEAASTARIPAGAGHDLVVANCLTCHTAALIEQQRKDAAGWDRTVAQMVAWGAPLRPDQQPVLVAYLAEHFGPR